MNLYLVSAAGLSACWMLVHVIIGGRQCERPLAANTTLPNEVRETMILCWHLVTGMLALMALFLVLGALGRRDMALAGVLLAAMSAGIGISVPPLRRLSYAVLPQGWLFVPVMLLGAWGLWGG
ncbi:hypothetical protein R1T40_03985 [Tritonibacter scottomollicae]|uniref:Uncharacterized protein n=1 Tax=Tritonibacter scottomollicae TaxID=483013 RepID=A0ABZ0HGG8_TRISK|nr:hypothetical protein [Tritonibacter scottomollicae]WOI33913.1 hypothetical protein R1T40_03985 [Tritonibacter scottomollicae]